MYTRHTELRKLRNRDEHQLVSKLYERDVKCLMEIIPNHLNAQQCSNKGALDWQDLLQKNGRKYNYSNFESIRNAYFASGCTRPIAEIFLDEWKTSGTKEERPTLGVLIQLLIGVDCWMAADFVATKLLQEEKPERGKTGPAARYDKPLPEMNEDVEEYLNNASEPNTSDLVNNSFNGMNNNQDYRTKFILGKGMPISKTNERDKLPGNLEEPPAGMVNGLSQANMNNTTTTTNATNTQNTHSNIATVTGLSVPDLSLLMKGENTSTVSHTSENAIEDSSASFDDTPHTLPNFSMFLPTPPQTKTQTETDTMQQIGNEMLPQLRELYIDCDTQRQQHHQNQQQHHEAVITGGSTSSSNSNSSMSNNEETNNEHDLPNLSIFDQNSSNNDSSLTSVTGTSGENSFEISSMQDEQEMSIRSRSCLEEVDANQSELISQDNLPCLSALQQ